MSWHSGDWANFSVAFTSAIASISAAIAAFKSKKTSDKALRYQKEIIASERKRNIEESLKNNARRANDAIGELWPEKWNFNHISSIANSMFSAKNDILNEINSLMEVEVKDLKKLYLNHLSEKIVWEIYYSEEPEGMKKELNGNVMSLVLLKRKWSESRSFFQIEE
ncbi:hypothetical protein FVB43_04735 [Erwinia rhapontici]|uniref:hypothetical protein n=1 Tax=Erwinia rhapontici TaxID=55212 RepID=UPI0014383A7D|nr:hypothetical protein [Erwinia rhapontici]NKG29345.1 hypothetical protein [Erwinia rhapontici]